MQRSLFRQSLWAEYASLKETCPEGLYVTISPGDPSRWTGVIFVRQGPYAPAVLRFQFLFLEDFPISPPLITFSTDIFHPLVNSLTTYSYTAPSSDGDAASTTEHESLPPGGFSLRHGFPHWFSRQRGRSSSNSRVKGSEHAASRPSPGPEASVSSLSTAPPNFAAENGTASAATSAELDVPVLALLEYIRAAFTDESLLDSIPLDAAANQGAYHAWRSFRAHDATDDYSSSRKASAVKTRRPGEWNWEGVWEERVKKGIRASLSEQVLFGGAASSDDLIRFANLDDEMGDAVKQLISHVHSTSPSRQMTATS